MQAKGEAANLHVTCGADVDAEVADGVVRYDADGGCGGAGLAQQGGAAEGRSRGPCELSQFDTWGRSEGRAGHRRAHFNMWSGNWRATTE